LPHALSLGLAEYDIHELLASLFGCFSLPIFVRLNGDCAFGEIHIAVRDGGLQCWSDPVDADEKKLALSIFHGLMIDRLDVESLSWKS
jgi:hypothetical protein